MKNKDLKQRQENEGRKKKDTGGEREIKSKKKESLERRIFVSSWYYDHIFVFMV